MLERSMTVAPAGIATFAPTSLIRVPSTRITWLVSARPASGSMSRPARIAVTGAGAGVCPATAATANQTSTPADSHVLDAVTALITFSRGDQTNLTYLPSEVDVTLPPCARVYFLNQLIM